MVVSFKSGRLGIKETYWGCKGWAVATEDSCRTVVEEGRNFVDAGYDNPALGMFSKYIVGDRMHTGLTRIVGHDNYSEGG